jgi:hypothetical protein
MMLDKPREYEILKEDIFPHEAIKVTSPDI